MSEEMIKIIADTFEDFDKVVKRRTGLIYGSPGFWKLVDEAMKKELKKWK